MEVYPLKTIPALSVTCKPLAAVAKWTSPNIAVCDVLCNLQRPCECREVRTVGTDALPLVGPGVTGSIEEAENVRWWDLWDDGDKLTYGGYTVNPVARPFSNMVRDEEAKRQIKPPDNQPRLYWVPSGDTKQHWHTVLPDREPLATSIKFGLCDADTTCHAKTSVKMPKNQQWGFELQLTGIAPDTTPWILFKWANDWMMIFTQEDMVLGRQKLGSSAASGAPPVGQNDLTALRRTKQFQKLWDFEMIGGNVVKVGERLVIEDYEGHHLTYTDRSAKGTPANQDEHQVAIITLPEANLHVKAHGVSFVLRVHEIGYETPEGKDVPCGSFTRKLNIAQPIPKNCEAYAVGWDSQNGGHLERVKKTVEVEINPTSATPQKGTQAYACTLKAGCACKVPTGNPFTAQVSPVVQNIIVNVPAVWRKVTSNEQLELRPALTEVVEVNADPELQAGSMFTIQGDREVLRDLPSPTGVGAVGDDWQTYIADYHECRVEAAWLYEDGVQRAFHDPLESYAQWVGRGAGYLYGVDIGSQPGYDRTFTLNMRDPIVMMTDNAGLVDEKFAPIDMIQSRLLRQNPTITPMVFGADAVHYILETQFGKDEADRLQVYYPHWTGKWKDVNHAEAGLDYKLQMYSLFTWYALTQPPGGANGMLFTPPYGNTIHDWIRQFATIDYATFWYGRDWDDPTKLCPCYGNYYAYARHYDYVTYIKDAKYHQGDENWFLQGADLGSVPQADYNRVAVWGTSPLQTPLNGLMPALPAFSAQRTINNSPIAEQNANRTWERTLVLQGTQFYHNDLARRVARNATVMLEGTRARRFAAKHRGLEWLWWGQLVRFFNEAAESDPDLQLKDEQGNYRDFRVMRVTNHWMLGQNPVWEATTNVAENFRNGWPWMSPIS